MIDKTKYYQTKLQEKEFRRISEYIENNYGIKLPLTKMIMVQNRLYKRLIATQILTFEQYVNYIFSNKGKNELEAMVDELTTNKTEFFREIEHFHYLQYNIFKNSLERKFKIWSAGCSTGEEAYSLAITTDISKVKYQIIGTDLSSKALKTAKNGIYKANQLAKLPKHLVLNYFDHQILENKKYYKVKDFLKNHVNFFKLNLKEHRYNLPSDFDIIFLRNVLIYFSQRTQDEVLEKVTSHLKHGGYLFIGFSEAVYNRHLSLQRIGPSIYQKINKNE